MTNEQNCNAKTHASSIPHSWAEVPFSWAFQTISTNNKKVAAKQYLTEGKLPVIDQGQSYIGGYTDNLDLAIDPQEGLIVFGDHTRVFKRVRFPFAPGADGIKVLKPILTDCDYAYYACLSLRFPDKGYSRHFSHLVKCEFPVAPQNEQRRIVSKIDELFSRIDEGERALERVQKLLERYRQSVLKAAVTGQLTREWREQNKDKLESGEALLARILKARREAWEQTELEKMKANGKVPADDKWKAKYKEPAAPDTTELPDLPEGWVWASFPQLGEFGRGKSKHRPRNDPRLFGGKYPFLQTGKVRSSKGLIREFDTSYSEFGLAQSKIWPKGTICITIAANIAESGILEFDACFPDSIVGLAPYQNVNAEYVEFFIRTERSRLDRYAPATAQKNINLEVLEQVAVPLPSCKEQVAIYSVAQEHLSRISDTERTLQVLENRIMCLRNSVLSAAFSGNLVPQDSTDEPASVLLERIAAERAVSKTIAPKRARRKKVSV